MHGAGVPGGPSAVRFGHYQQQQQPQPHHHYQHHPHHHLHSHQPAHHAAQAALAAGRPPKTGLCSNVENYISELGHWAVWRAIIMGQFLSLVLCLMTLLNHHINTSYRINLPTGQNLAHYAMMLLVYTSWMSCRGAGNGLFSVMRARGWRYLLLALIDVEANTLITASHQFTSLASIQLLDCVAIPVALALSCLVLGVRYRMVHIVGVSVCLMGVGCLVWAGIEDNKDPASAGKNQLVGDMLCLGGAVLFSIITVLQELAVKSIDIIEYLGMMGFFGTILCGSQIAVLEKVQIESFPFDNVLLMTFLVVYCITQFVFYSLVPVVLYETGATALQLTLLTADIFNILFGMLLHKYKFHTLYFLSYMLTMTGIYIYAIKRTPMSSGSRRQHQHHQPHHHQQQQQQQQQHEPTAADYRHMQQQQQQQLDGGADAELATSSGMSGAGGTLDHARGPSSLGCDGSSLPLSVSSDTAFTSFYGSQANLKPSRSQARLAAAGSPSGSGAREPGCPSATLRSA
ncbi:solute carrier family 35 member F2-like isoform X2 [Phymastichus coffea]|uniref:solute carrier family 35 member F2-like isoform X2 n=1 Tax=Phymastichus coffea TaxID=108790 RepID=UPI00273C75B4|nr:solute carrier family 35 member F2-like isoform X2 [Phymastichus coffea]